MEYNIRAYVDELFRDAPDTQRAYELKVELVQNLVDKYNDLVASGTSEEDAYNITIYGIGDISELLEEMRREEPAQPFFGQQSGGYYTAMSYFRRRSAAMIAVAVALYIFSIIPVVVLGVLSEVVHEEYLAALGVAGMFTFAGIATALLIWNALTKPKADDPPEIVVDLYNRKKGGSPVLKAVESGFWILVVAAYFLLSFLTHRWDITWLIFLVAPAVWGILHAAASRK